MIQTAFFKIDPRLAMLLGETYRSTEHALKELIDNAWDADAENIWVELPDPMTSAPIVIKDDGIGMEEQEVRREYLAIARDRRSGRGDRTPWKSRRVKGRKGIGKFAGLMAADLMQMETRAAGTATFLTIPRQELVATEKYLEQFELLINTIECDPSEHGTTVTLSDLNQNLAFPSPDRLKELLIVEYGGQEDFLIHINGQLLTMEDFPGKCFHFEADLEHVGAVSLHFKLIDRKQKLKNSGISVRVGGKVVGRPGFFGLEHADDIPPGMLRQVFGELDADGLADDTTADWGAFIENSKAFRSLEEWGSSIVCRELLQEYRWNMKMAHSRLKREITERLVLIPVHRRDYAEEVMDKLLLRSYGLSEDRLKPITFAVLDALEGMPV